MAKANNHIVKRAGHSEAYDERKLYASVYSSCLAVRETQATSEMIAERVCADVMAWLKTKHEVTSHDLRARGAMYLKMYNDDAAWIFKHHRNIG